MNALHTKRKLSQTIDNPSGLQILTLISMFYMSIMLVNAVLTNRYIGTDKFFLLGGVFLSPFLFVLDDIIAEIYGYKISRCVILSAFAGQTLFALICQLVMVAPSPPFFKLDMAYKSILGVSFLRIDLGGFIAYVTANLMNSYILTRWKILLKGRHFWLRSLGSSAFSEAIYSFIAVIIIEFNSIPIQNLLKITLVIYSVKLSFSLIFSVPSSLLVKHLKNYTSIDVYDFPKRFTPIHYFQENFQKEAKS